MFNADTQQSTGQGMATVGHTVPMENDSPQTSATLLIVPGLLVVELESALSLPTNALFPSYGTEGRSEPASLECEKIPTSVRSAGS